MIYDVDNHLNSTIKFDIDDEKLKELNDGDYITLYITAGTPPITRTVIELNGYVKIDSYGTLYSILYDDLNNMYILSSSSSFGYYENGNITPA